MRTLLFTSALASIALAFLATERSTDHGGAHGASTTPGGDVCATGCAALPRSADELSEPELEQALSAFAEAPCGPSGALETLLFYGAQTRRWLDDGRRALPSGHEAHLRTELARTHATLDVRVVDELGVERLRLGERRVPLGVKQHLAVARTRDLQPPEVSGTVRRVGVDRLWARL